MTIFTRFTSLRSQALIIVALWALAPATQAAITVPPAFTVSTFASGPELSFITGLAFDGQGVLHVSEANIFAGTGRVLRVEDLDADGSAETISEYASGFGLVTGISFRGEGFPLPLGPCAPAAPASGAVSGGAVTDLERIRRGAFASKSLDLYVSHFVPGPGGGGTISVVRDIDGDGVAEERDDVVTGLPSDGDSGNQQLAVGPDGLVYFGQGARTNAGVPAGGPADGPLNATILRMQADGSELEVFASGLRNPYSLLFTPCGELFATENGPDAGGPAPVIGAPDELNAILGGFDYGWPDHFGWPPADSGTLGPIAEFASGSSTDGIALVTPETFCGFGGDIMAAQFGSFSDPTIGRKLLRIRFVGQRGIIIDEFASGFGRPLDVAFGPDGALYVADFSNFFLSPASGVIYRIVPRDTDGDGTPDICEGMATTRLGPARSR